MNRMKINRSEPQKPTGGSWPNSLGWWAVGGRRWVVAGGSNGRWSVGGAAGPPPTLARGRIINEMMLLYWFRYSI